MRKAKVLAFLLALAMVVTALVPATVQAAGKVVTVGTQAELEEALKDPEVTKIAIKAKKGKTLTIPEGDYSGIALVVEAAKVKLNNHGTFRVVKVRDAKEYNEHATGNTVKITAPKITVAVAETAEVKALHLAKKDAEHTVEIKGEVKKVTVAESAKVDLTVDGTLETLNVKKASDVTVAGTTEKTIVVNTSIDSHGTTLESAVTVDVRTKDFIEVTLTEGSEGSDVVVKTEAGDVKLDNQTETSVLVEEADGTQHEATLENVVDTRDQAEVEPGTSDDTTTEDGETEDTTGDETTGDETTGDDTTTEDTTGDTTTGNTTGDTTTGGSTGSSTTVTPPVVIPTFTVSFDLNGGTGTAGAQTVYYGQTATQPTAPTKTGYTFAGWNNGSAAYDFSAAVTGNVTLTAQWTANLYTVTFNSNGGTTVNPIQVAYSSAVSSVVTDMGTVAPTRTGYNFEGWFTTAGERLTLASIITEDITVTAKWDCTPATAEELVAVINAGEAEITLGDNIVLGDTVITIPAGKTIAIDLNGKSLDASTNMSRPFAMSEGASLTINGNGGSVKCGKYGLINVPAGTSCNITLNNGTYTANTDNGAFIKLRSGNGTVNITLNNVKYTDSSSDGFIFNSQGFTGTKTLNVTGGQYVAHAGFCSFEGTVTGASITTQGVAFECHGEAKISNCTITVDPGATVGSAPAAAVAASSNGKATVTGCTISGNMYAVYDVYTSGGSIVATGNTVNVGTGTKEYDGTLDTATFPDATAYISIDGTVVVPVNQ